MKTTNNIRIKDKAYLTSIFKFSFRIISIISIIKLSCSIRWSKGAIFLSNMQNFYVFLTHTLNIVKLEKM